MRAFRLLLSVSVFAVVIACGSPTAPPELGNGSAVGGEMQVDKIKERTNQDLDKEVERWNVMTDTEGMATCVFKLVLSRRAAKIKDGFMDVRFKAFQGEAEFTLFGIRYSTGVSPGCDIFPKGPATQNSVTPAAFVAMNGGSRKLRIRVKLHAHPSFECNVPINSIGRFQVRLSTLGESRLRLRDRDLRLRTVSCQ